MKFKGTIIYLSIILSLIAILFNTCNDAKYYKSAYNVSTDSLVSYVNKQGLNESKIKELELSKKDLKKELDTLKITNRTKTITEIKTVTKYVTKYKTNVEYDTIDNIVYPIYSSDVNDKWYKAKVKATKDSTYLDVSFYNSLLLKREQKRGLFKPTNIELTIIQENPNTITSEVNSYKVKSKQPLFNFSVQSGLGIDLISKKPTVYSGIGIGLNLIR